MKYILFLFLISCSAQYERIEALNNHCSNHMDEWCKAQYRVVSEQTTECTKDYDCDKFGYVCRYGACLREN